MDLNLNMVLDQVAKDRGISRETLISTLEEAILAAAHKTFGEDRRLEARYNAEKGAVEVSQTITVVEHLEDPTNEILLSLCQERGIEVEAGDEMVFQIYYLDSDNQLAREQDDLYGDILKLKTYRRSFGRIAAQTAKQVILQRVRDAERDVIYSEYKDRKGELINGVIRRFERGNIIVDLGRAEAVLPIKEQCPREAYRVGDRVQAFVLDVLPAGRGHQIILSRAAPELIMKLFEIEVPEIYEGIVRIESVARDPGVRSKIAVSSYDRDVDPVGACVGMRGARVQSVVQELRGEKIDIVPWSDDPATFVCNALAPAEVSRVLMDEGNHTMEIIVPDDQLSLAIGRKGQNVRLAAQLTGWKLDVHSETRIREIRDRAWKSLSGIEGINGFMIQTLYNAGVRSARELAECDAATLAQLPGFSAEGYNTINPSARARAEQEVQDEERSRQDAQRVERSIEVGRRLLEWGKLSERDKLMRLRGVGERIADELAASAFATVTAVAACEDLEALGQVAEIGLRKAKQFKYAANQLLSEEAALRQEATALEVEIVDGQVRFPGLPVEEPAPVAPAASTEPPPEAAAATADADADAGAGA